MQACFLPADILLPDAAADFEKWAVVACDQFTSQPEYWRKAAEIVGDAPSTLNLVYPEAYLAEGDARIAAIRQAMEMAVSGDIVVLAGKGHETYQEIRGVKHPFDEKVIVSELLEEIAGENRAE